jgi:hypothetical protein
MKSCDRCLAQSRYVAKSICAFWEIVFLQRQTRNRKLSQMAEDSFLNCQKIVFWGKEKTIQVDVDSVTWGQQVLLSLNLGSMSDFEKTQKICTYLSDNFRFNFQRNLSIREIIEKKGGNCVSHALMGIFLLRMAGIPAKFAHEVHIIKQ